MLKLGLIGSSIGSSLSPAIFHWLSSRSGIPLKYDLCQLPPETLLAEALEELRAKGYDGLNVTRPFKAAILDFFPMDESVRMIGAANWMDFSHRKIANTDHLAITELLNEHQPKSALIYGAGGAARAAVSALKHLGAQVIAVANRSDVSAFAAAMQIQADNGRDRYDWLIQASPETRLEGNLGQALARTEKGVFEMVYSPAVTPLLTAASAKNLKRIDGVAMLIQQAVLGFEGWTQTTVPRAWCGELRNSLEAK